MKFSFENIKDLKDNFFLIAGPCAVENEKITFEVARELKQICLDLDIPFIFKASFRKANRTRSNSFTGIGDTKAIEILRRVRDGLQIPITTDIHESHEAEKVADVVDIIQIPAFLCRQTELLRAAARTGKIVNIKKGQFMSAPSMNYAAEKVREENNNQVILTERGNSFGYIDLIVDMRNIPIMKSSGCTVVLDCTHANQKPNQSSGVTEGTALYIEVLAKAGLAAGADGIFLETHPHPSSALSDGSNMLPLSEVAPLLKRLKRLKKALHDG